MYSLVMLTISLELARENEVYADLATKFFEHFLYIAGALNDIAGKGISIWDDEDEFFYDVLRYPDGGIERIRVHSLVGLIPLLAVETIDEEIFQMLPDFRTRTDWFIEHRPDLASLISRWEVPGMRSRHLLALVRGHRMKRLFKRMLDPEEFLSDYGIRSVSRYHRDTPYRIDVGGMEYTVRYDPGDSTSGLFGGNSNWRGPIWFPINYLLLEACLKFHQYYGDDFRIECPTGSGAYRTLREVGLELNHRLTRIFLKGPDGARPVHGDNPLWQQDPHWRDLLLFYEYFHGDTGAGIGASHQTGWTALVARLLVEEQPDSPLSRPLPRKARERGSTGQR
jgi:hypothetical protein